MCFFKQAVTRGIISAVQCIFERQRVSRTVALENQPAQPQQRRTVVAAVVHLSLEALEHRRCDQGRQPAQDTTAEFPPQCARKQGGQALGRLQRHVADKAIAHNDVDRALEQVVAFDIAVEVDVPAGSRRTQQFGSLLDHLVALDRLFADVEQAHGRLGLAFDSRQQRAAHHCKLQQMCSRAVDIGTQIEHRGVAALLIGQIA